MANDISSEIPTRNPNTPITTATERLRNAGSSDRLVVGEGLVLGAAGATALAAVELVSALSGTPSSVDANRAVSIQEEAQRIDVNKQIVLASRPDLVKVGHLVIDFSQIKGVRNGDYVDNDSRTSNLVPSDQIEEINGQPVEISSQVVTIDNPLIEVGASNDGISDTSQYVEVFVKTKGESFPRVREIALGPNTYPAVRFQGSSQTLNVTGVSSSNIEVKTIEGAKSSIPLSGVNNTTIIPRPNNFSTGNH